MSTRFSRLIAALGGAVLGLGLVASIATAADTPDRTHRLAIHVDSADPAIMTMALNNAMSAKRYYDSKGEKLEIEIVAYGPGITMLRADTSPVKEVLGKLQSSVPGAVLSMCGNAKAAAEKVEGHEVPVIQGARVVPAGVVRLMELQEQGWSYLRP